MKYVSGGVMYLLVMYLYVSFMSVSCLLSASVGSTISEEASLRHLLCTDSNLFMSCLWKGFHAGAQYSNKLRIFTVYNFLIFVGVRSVKHLRISPIH